MTVAFVLVPSVDSSSFREELCRFDRIKPVFYTELTTWHPERCIVAPIDHYLSLGVFDFPCPVICYGDISLLALAFRAGCRDYLKDPWLPQELVARLNVLLDTHYPESKIRKEIRFSLAGRTLSGPSRPIELTEHETKALRLLLASPSKEVSRETLETSLDLHPQTRSLDMAISRLRKKFLEAGETPHSFTSILTVRAGGYKLSPLCCVDIVDNLVNHSLASRKESDEKR